MQAGLQMAGLQMAGFQKAGFQKAGFQKAGFQKAGLQKAGLQMTGSICDGLGSETFSATLLNIADKSLLTRQERPNKEGNTADRNLPSLLAF